MQEKAQHTTKNMLCLFMKKIGGGPIGDSNVGPLWRVSSNGEDVFFEKSATLDVFGEPVWQRMQGLSIDLPGKVRRFIAETLVTKQNARDETVFNYAVDETTPELVRDLVGMPLWHAAITMAAALKEASIDAQQIRHALSQTILSNESAHGAAVRVIHENQARIKQLESQIAELNEDASELSKLVQELESKLVGKHELPKKSPSLNQRAIFLMKYLVMHIFSSR